MITCYLDGLSYNGPMLTLSIIKSCAGTISFIYSLQTSMIEFFIETIVFPCSGNGDKFRD